MPATSESFNVLTKNCKAEGIVEGSGEGNSIFLHFKYGDKNGNEGEASLTLFGIQQVEVPPSLNTRLRRLLFPLVF